MTVDKFGRNGDKTTAVYTGINITNLTNSFLSRDGGNNANWNYGYEQPYYYNVADPLSNQDVATENYVNKNAITTAVGVLSGHIKLNIGSDGKESRVQQLYNM